MKFIIQSIVVILAALIINDTLHFLYDESRRFISTQIEVRGPYEATEFQQFEPVKHIPDNEIDEDASIFWCWFTATIAVIYLSYKIRRRQSLVADNKLEVDQETNVESEPVANEEDAEPVVEALAVETESKKDEEFEETKELVQKLTEGTVDVEPKVSFISTTYESSRPSVIVASDNDDVETSDVEFELRRVSAVADFDSIFKLPPIYQQVESRFDRSAVDLTSTFSSSLGTSRKSPSNNKCDCNIDNFEERLGVVEHGLKQTEEATKEWAKRIEQSEVDLVNLNRQMYNVLSNAEFKAPNSEAFTRNFKKPSSCIGSFSTKSYKFDDSLLYHYTSNNNWATVMESEVEKKINEIKGMLSKKIESSNSDSTHRQQSKLTIPSIDENVVEKEDVADEPGDTFNESELDDVTPGVVETETTKDWTRLMTKEVNKKIAEMKQEMSALDATVELLPNLDGKDDYTDEPREGSPEKDGDLMTKTIEIVKDIEEVVYQESPRVTKIAPRVPTHVVPPYKRISFAETDGTVSLGKSMKSTRQKSKFK